MPLKAKKVCHFSDPHNVVVHSSCSCCCCSTMRKAQEGSEDDVVEVQKESEPQVEYFNATTPRNDQHPLLQ